MPLVAGVALLGISAGLDLFDRVVHWGKLVHAVEGACLAAVVAVLLLGHRDYARTSLANQLAALAAMLVGVTAGVVWELIEFVLDWVADLEVQKSNTDTMTDFLWTDFGVVVGTLLAVHAYAHWVSDAERAASGALAERLARPVTWLLDRHGHLVAALALLIMAAAVIVLWFTGRPIPGLPSD